MSNAVYRDLVRTSLIVGARYLALGVMVEYQSVGSVAQSYRDAKDLLEAVYASGRLQFPFEGILLFGYLPREGSSELAAVIRFVAPLPALSVALRRGDPVSCAGQRAS